jgi:hypothetical protein
MKRQKGLTLTGMVLVSAIVIAVLLLAFKIVPVYTEYFTVQRHLKAMSLDPKLRTATRPQIATAWAARAAVDNLTSISPDQVEMERVGDGIVLSAEYAVKVPLFRNVAACFDFKATSE